MVTSKKIEKKSNKIYIYYGLNNGTWINTLSEEPMQKIILKELEINSRIEITT